jgi:hypothetical protein
MSSRLDDEPDAHTEDDQILPYTHHSGQMDILFSVEMIFHISTIIFIDGHLG